jgi:hypothetical protein
VEEIQKQKQVKKWMIFNRILINKIMKDINQDKNSNKQLKKKRANRMEEAKVSIIGIQFSTKAQTSNS